MVQEFQLSSLNFDLSTGIGAGGAVNIVTRAGGNDFHGSGFFFFRDHHMAAYPYLAREPHEPASPFFARRQSGYAVGGPIKKDRLFFFSSLEHTNQTGVFGSFPNDPLFRTFAVSAPVPFHENELTERVDHRITARHNAFLRYSHDGNHAYAPMINGGLPSDWDVDRNFADSGVLSLVSVLSPSAANEFRYSMSYWSNTNNPPTASECPQPCLGLGMPNTRIHGVTNFILGNATNVPQSRILRRHMFADNLSRQQGRHTMKLGASWENQHGTGTYAFGAPATTVLFSPEEVWAFNSQTSRPFQIQIPTSYHNISDILQLPVARFSMGVGDISQPPAWHRSQADHNNVLHFYWQDTWRISARFALNYGLGWSYESNALNHDLTKPAFLAPVFGTNGLGHELHSPHNFSPSLGFTWTATRDNKTVVRAGAGIYYDTINLEMRLIERSMLGPAGTGRTLLGDSVFFQTIAKMNHFDGLPNSLRPTSLSRQPTTFTAGELVEVLPQFYSYEQQQMGPPGNLSLSIRNIDVFKTGTELLARDFRPPYSEHTGIGVQREVRSDLLISADFVFRQYQHQTIRDTDLNHYYSSTGPVIAQCKGTQAADRSAQCSTGVIQAMISGARAHYKGLLLKADKRFSHRTTATLSYAYASQTGYNGLVDDRNWFRSWGPQAGHHILTGSLIVDLPWGLQAAGITVFSSAAPFQPVVSGVDLNSNGAVAAGETAGSPLPGGGYNEFGIHKDKRDLVALVDQFNQTYAGTVTSTGRIRRIILPDSFSFPRSFHSQDIRVTKNVRLGSEHIKLSIFGECFNTLNIANLSGYSGNLNAPGFGKPTQRTSNVFGSGGPRAFQLGARVTF